MAGVQAANASRKIEKFVAVNVFDQRALGAREIPAWRGSSPRGTAASAALHERARLVKGISVRSWMLFINSLSAKCISKTD